MLALAGWPQRLWHLWGNRVTNPRNCHWPMFTYRYGLARPYFNAGYSLAPGYRPSLPQPHVPAPLRPTHPPRPPQARPRVTATHRSLGVRLAARVLTYTGPALEGPPPALPPQSWLLPAQHPVPWMGLPARSLGPESLLVQGQKHSTLFPKLRIWPRKCPQAALQGLLACLAPGLRKGILRGG